jgi:hypothetical protein
VQWVQRRDLETAVPTNGRAAGACLLTLTLLLGACNSGVGANERGGIGYSVKLPSGSVVLGSPAGKLPQNGEAISLKVGQNATIAAANEATPDFQTNYRMVPADPAVVQVAGDAVGAKHVGNTTVLIEALSAQPLIYCLRENKPSCNLLNITVTP